MFSLQKLSVLATLVASIAASPLYRRQCTATLDVAKSVASELQSTWFNSLTGQYNSGELWTDANTLEDIHNLMLATGTDEWSSLADDSYIGSLAEAGADWDGVINGSNDDAQWIILALWKMGDYKLSRGQDNSKFVNAASTIYNTIAGQWDTGTCGGGVWWSTAHTYKNAITNHLFLYTSAEGYIRNGDQTYLDNAKKTWAWLAASGMKNSDGLWNDGLDSSNPNACVNNGQTTWTYNQGVVAAGLGALAHATGDTSYLDLAEVTLDAAASKLTSGGILKESCDDATSSSCDADQQIFKGIWTKHLQYYLDRASDATRSAKYSGILGAQDSGVVHYGTGANWAIGNVWYAPSNGGSKFTPQSQTSGLAAHIADAKYGPC
ncbi:glycoside hydrolase family 76 protein [Plicaturopsis crispa FD-325 SS-3]|nr:glycoside hydrolase family 76 protein [Plicaturopsis crispa FD-325 SS-3]